MKLEDHILGGFVITMMTIAPYLTFPVSFCYGAIPKTDLKNWKAGLAFLKDIYTKVDIKDIYRMGEDPEGFGEKYSFLEDNYFKEVV